MKHPKVLGVIIARGGSRGLPRKNIRLLAGRPLIAYTIDAGRDARLMDRCVLSTEDDEIADVARGLGADVPFMRPPELAEDDVQVFPVLRHATRWLEEHQGYAPDYVMLLQPTTPLRTAADIDAAISLAVEKDADAVVSWVPAKEHPYWMKQVAEDGRLVEFLPSAPAYSRRQDMPKVGYASGCIFMARREIILYGDTFDTDNTYAFVFPRERAIDIDSLLDLRMAELVLTDSV